MKLTALEVARYFNLMWSLQAYVNQNLAIIPDVATVKDYKKLPSGEKMKVRNKLYENIDLIDRFLEESHHQLSTEDSDIIRSWKQFQRGDFFIARLLKRHAIFIQEQRVYGVLALRDSFADVFSFLSLPYYAKAVLLPFKGRIIYDGLIEGYSISFGGGIKSRLNETYMVAKQNGLIIESLDAGMPLEKAIKRMRPTKDYAPMIEKMFQQAKQLRSSTSAPALHSPAFSMAKASIEFAKTAAENPDDTDALWQALGKVARAIRKAETVLRRAGLE